MPQLLDSIRHLVPASWGDITSGKMRYVVLDNRTAEYQTITAQLQSTLNVTPNVITRVQNPYVWGMYLLKKAEYLLMNPATRELDLWHATSVPNAEKIVMTNLDWRRAKRVKFGKGVSFSPSAKYANMECNHSIPTWRALMLCKVLVGNVHPGSYKTVLPENGFDTTIGRGGQVYVKYADNEFYPEYVVYYNSPLV